MEKKNLFDKKIFIFDLDGVIYLGNQIVPGALEVINKLEELGKKVYYLTNNSTRTREDYVKKLEKMGIKSKIENIITSAYAAALYLRNKEIKKKKKSNVFVIGETGIVSELEKMGFKTYTDFKEELKINYVVVGLDSNFDYKKLSGGLYYISKGAEFIATNADPTLPTEKYALPGAGTMVSALETATNKKPSVIIGKPNPYTIDSILKREKVRSQDAVMVGDRISTDILAGKNANTTTVFVKTGAGNKEASKSQSENIFPDLILNSVKDLLQLLKEKKADTTMRIAKPSKFYFFLENFAKYTAFERMEMINLFKQILKEQELVLKNYKQEFSQIWKNWGDEYGGAEVANFFENNCVDLMLKWLAVIFPFRKEDFKINIKKGGTNVDVVMDISYFFTEKELNFIEFLIKEFAIEEITAQVALIRTLAETILIFCQIWNEISGYDFTIMPEEEKTNKKGKGIAFNMLFTLRPSF